MSRTTMPRVEPDALALAALVPALALEPAVHAGGIAVLLVAAAVALVVSAPLAGAIRAEEARPLPAAVAPWATTLERGAVGAVIGAAVLRSDLGNLGGLLAFGVPMLGAILCLDALRGVRRFAWIGVAIAPLLVLAAVPTSPPAISPWTALQPQWDLVGTWWPYAVVLGVLTSLAGTGRWSRTRGDRGPRHAPWAVVGAVLLLELVWATTDALAYELAPLDAAPLLTGMVALPAALMVGLVATAPAARTPLAGGLEIAGWAVWFWWAGATAAHWWVLGMVPAATAVGLAWHALNRRGVQAAMAGAAAVGAAAATIGLATWPPDGPEALGASLTVVLGLWIAEGRRLGGRP